MEKKGERIDMKEWKTAIGLFLTRHPASSHDKYYTERMDMLINDDDGDYAAEQAWDELSDQAKNDTDKESFFDEFYDQDDHSSRSVLNFKLTEKAAHYGDGDGSSQYIVFKLENTTTAEECFIRFTGERSSWDEDSWDKAPQLVEPYEVKVIKWREIK